MKDRIGNKLAVEVGEESLTLEPEHFSIDETSIDRELCQMGSLLIAYGTVEVKLKVELERREAALQKLEADLDEDIRHEARNEGAKITEGIVAAKIRGSDRRAQALASIRDIRNRYEILRWATRSLQAKRDCLIALAYRDKELIRADRSR